MNDFKTLLVTQPDDHILLVTLNRPKASNAFNTQMAWDLCHLFESCSTTTDDVRAIIVTGSGDRAFCAGGDLKERDGMSDQAWFAQHQVYERMIRAIISCPIPVIGAINGAAYGGGCELVAAFDFAFAADTVRFAQTEVKIGIIPGAGGTQTLARAVGERRAKQIILTGDPFDAEQAFTWGLINGVFSQDRLLDETISIAKKIATNAPIAVRQAKLAIHKGLQMGMMDGLAFEVQSYNRTVPTQDRREGVAAFNQKRPAKFKGC